MQTAVPRAVEDCLEDLFKHLGIERAHVAAAGQPTLTDWYGLATRYSDRIATLTVLSPPIVDTGGLEGVAPRLLSIAGDTGPSAQGGTKLKQDLPSAELHVLRGYECFAWSDLMADRGAEIGRALRAFCDRQAVPGINLPEGEGEVAGISYRIRGSGPPLVLLPLALAPSQWEPLLPGLAERYCTISLGGPLLGVVGLLEARGRPRSTYLGLVRTLLDLAEIRPDEVILEVGGGSGVVLREIARRTMGANRIIDVDINPYLLREAAALERHHGLADQISFREGSAEAIPLADNSVDIALSLTVMEEGDADKMLAELVRVTRPGGRIAAAVRSRDIPCWTSAPLNPVLRAKVDQAGLINAGVAAKGCADASLYQRFLSAGLKEVSAFPQFVSITPTEVSVLEISKQRALATLSSAEADEWRAAVDRAEAEGTFFIAVGHHCAVGTKP
jgi:ubiquinone/menaquinone biosynthesis C-methylase UbiE